ncbi:DUF507 family protein [Candidatus Sumerlaeota bacterium]|nr:DUF507 family protein [Candidatus Sumerlaeota bacterium]
MRLKPEKIEDLAQKIVAEFKKHPEMALRVPENDIIHEIRNMITMDLEREDQLEEEARQILKQHMGRVSREDINYIDLVRRAKKQLAKERGLIL